MFDNIVITSEGGIDIIRIISWLVCEGEVDIPFYDENSLDNYTDRLDRLGREYTVIEIDVPPEAGQYDGVSFEGGRDAAVAMINGMNYKKTTEQEIKEQITDIQLAVVELYENIGGVG